jgi:acetylornithine deacetylase/succinyl-diaminopimelate desuccinylase-like protein
LATSRFKADLGIVGEPTILNVVTAHKGSLWLRLQTNGRAAHGSRPELGRNAVYEMARVVTLLETDYARLLSRRKHYLLGSPSVSLGVIRGGLQTNIIPDHCEILVDRRTLPGETEKSVHAELRTLLRQNKLNAVIENGKVQPSRPMETDPSLPMVRQFLKTAGARRPMGVAYYCDGSVLAHGGIPCIVFGPGDIAQAHTAEEWISKKSLNGAVAILDRFLRSLP